jgi:predicted solute-binding protein
MLHGDQRNQVALSFSVPSVCAAELDAGAIELGLAPVAEIARQDLDILPGLGIACKGPVRSILLFARVGWRKVQRLAVDSSSRTSVELARIIMRERFGIQPQLCRREPVLSEMLNEADSALVIGDPALRLNPDQIPFDCLDLGTEWLRLTGLPMVFAAWAGKPGIPVRTLSRLVQGSYAYGKRHLDEIVKVEAARRDLDQSLVSEYLTRRIRFEVGREENAGLAAFLELANLPHRALANTAS